MFAKLLSTLALIPFVSAAVIEKRGIIGPVISKNFTDPSFVFGLDSTYYAFASSSEGKNVPMAHTTDFKTWTSLAQDALPTVGIWSTGTNVSAPDVIQRVRPYS